MKRLQLLFDEGTFVEIDALAKSGEVLAEAVAGFGAVDGCPGMRLLRTATFPAARCPRRRPLKSIRFMISPSRRALLGWNL